MKILIFGGAFDPPHKGHYALLEAAIAELSPDLTLVIPSRESPHKKNSTRAFRHRFNMCRVFKRCSKTVRISAIERMRRGASYTIDTVRILDRRYKNAELVLLVGTDMLEYFEKWKDYRQLLARCTVAAGARADHDREALAATEKNLERQGGRVIILKNPVIEISSTEIRNALAAGGCSELLFDSTRDYIDRHGLYKEL